MFSIIWSQQLCTAREATIIYSVQKHCLFLVVPGANPLRPFEGHVLQQMSNACDEWTALSHGGEICEWLSCQHERSFLVPLLETGWYKVCRRTCLSITLIKRAHICICVHAHYGSNVALHNYKVQAVGELKLRYSLLQPSLELHGSCTVNS